MKILLTGQLVIAAVQILCIFENSGKAGQVNGGKEKKYKKPGICGYHVFVSGIVYLPDGVFFLLSIF